MMNKKTFAPLVAGFSLVAFSSSYALAGTASEHEPNNSPSAAQEVNPSLGKASMSAMMGSSVGTPHEDLDFYKFQAQAGDSLDVYIENGYKDDAKLNTVIAVFGPAPEYKVLRIMDYSESVTENSHVLDARIEDFVATETAVYTVGVSTTPRYFKDGGSTSSGFWGSSMESVVTEYQLAIEGVSDSVSMKKIALEVKPGSDELAPINPRSRGKIPVAILGSLNFSVVNIDTDTLTFGASGDEDSLHKCAKSAEDVNGDGHYDLVCHFNNRAAGFTIDSLEGVLKGNMESGNEPFEGRAYLKVLPNTRR